MRIAALFLAILGLSMLAEVIANPDPLVVVYQGKMFFPAFKRYGEKDFDPTLTVNRPIQFKDTKFGRHILTQSTVWYAPISYGPNTIDENLPAPCKPNARHWFGTDDHGRDVFVRLLYSIRTSLTFALILTALGTLIGVSIGALQGYFGNNVDIAIGRFLEVWCSLPSLFITLILSSFMQPTFWMLLLIMLMFIWIPLSIVTRTEFLRIRSLDYVRAAEVLGVSRFNIITKHILPNAMIAITSYTPFMVNMSIINLASLDFLGFGLPPEVASLGEMMRQAKDNLQAPWIGLTVFFAMSFMLTLLILMGEKLRDTRAHD